MFRTIPLNLIVQMIEFMAYILMLNVLISIVGDGYSQAQEMRNELSREQRARTIVDLENTYLRPFLSRNVVRRGKPCALIEYPPFLTQLTTGTTSLPLYVHYDSDQQH